MKVESVNIVSLDVYVVGIVDGYVVGSEGLDGYGDSYNSSVEIRDSKEINKSSIIISFIFLVK
jgi:hypothetical protein